MWVVEVGMGRKNSYSTRYEFATESQAYFHFACIHTHSGGKKRILNPAGKIVERVIT